MSFVEIQSTLTRLDERGKNRDLQVEELKGKVSSMEGKIDGLVDRFSKFQPCPAVGSCVPLAAELKDQGKRIASLEETRTEQRGAWKFAALAWAGLTAVGGLIGWAIAQGWHSHKP